MMPAQSTTPAVGGPGEETAFLPVQHVVAQAATLQSLGGRREWMEYLDFGVTDATDGRMRVQRTKINDGVFEPTGWHYHICELQWIYVVKGWLELELEDGRALRMEVGDAALLPGGFKHNETAMAPDLDVLEITLPAKIGTVVCDPPPAWADRASGADS